MLPRWDAFHRKYATAQFVLFNLLAWPFDLFHAGHVAFLRAARGLGDYLVGVEAKDQDGVTLWSKLEPLDLHGERRREAAEAELPREAPQLLGGGP